MRSTVQIQITSPPTHTQVMYSLLSVGTHQQNIVLKVIGNSKSVLKKLVRFKKKLCTLSDPPLKHRQGLQCTWMLTLFLTGKIFKCPTVTSKIKQPDKCIVIDYIFHLTHPVCQAAVQIVSTTYFQECIHLPKVSPLPFHWSRERWMLSGLNYA